MSDGLTFGCGWVGSDQLPAEVAATRGMQLEAKAAARERAQAEAERADREQTERDAAEARAFEARLRGEQAPGRSLAEVFARELGRQRAADRREPAEAQREQEWNGPPIATPAHRRFREATQARRKVFGIPK